jgi:hypothetical protein
MPNAEEIHEALPNGLNPWALGSIAIAAVEH